MQHYSQPDGRAETQVRVVDACRKIFNGVVAAESLRRQLYAQGGRSFHCMKGS